MTEKDFAKFLRSVGQFILTEKGLNNYILKENVFFNLLLEISQIKNIRTIQVQIGKKILGFRNTQEKLEKYLYFDCGMIIWLKANNFYSLKVRLTF